MQAEKFLQQLDPVIEQLREELPQAGYDRRNLGMLIGQLMQFQEDALGVNVSYHALYMQNPRLTMLCTQFLVRASFMSSASTYGLCLVAQAVQGQHKKQPKIPSKLLHNFAPRGPVFVVAAASHQFKARNPSVKRIDFLSPAKRTEVCLWLLLAQGAKFNSPPYCCCLQELH